METGHLSLFDMTVFFSETATFPPAVGQSPYGPSNRGTLINITPPKAYNTAEVAE